MISRNYEARTNPAVPKRTGPTRPINATVEELTAATSLLDTSQVVSPLAGLGGLSRADAAAVRAFSDDGGEWDDFYAYDDRGSRYSNLAGATVRVGGQDYVRPGTAVTKGRAPMKVEDSARPKTTTRDPAPITVTPTSTTNPDRPRTIAAGYDEARQVLTVVFRDGTYYNYYTVSPALWKKFKDEYSKGKQIIPKFLDPLPRGVANMRGVSPTSREQLYRINRSAQWISDGKIQYDRKAPRLDPTRQRKRK